MKSFARLGLLALLAIGCGGSGAPEVRELPPADPRAAQKYLEASKLLVGPKTSDERRAAALLQEALAIDPNLWEAHYNLGVLHRRRDELKQAQKHFAAAHDIQPSAAAPLRALAEVHYAMGDAGEAAEFLGQYVKAQPQALDARVALTALLREQGKHDAALEQARATLVADPKNAGALLEVGRIYRAREELDVAELVFTRALALDEKNARPHNELGLTALARGDTQLAFEHFERALAADVRFAPARMNRAAVLLRAGDYRAAGEEYERVLEQQNDHDDARVGLAVALRGQGKHKQAEAEYERVLSRSPNHAAALFDLGVLRAEFLDQRAEARALFERFVDIAGNGPQREVAERYVRDLSADPGSKQPPAEAAP